MTNKIIDHFLQKFPILNEQERNELAGKLNVKLFKKKEILQEEGKIPQNCFFVLEGCVRQYCIVDGAERSTEFYTPENAAISSDCYMNRSPSNFYLECLEDSTLLVGDAEYDEKLIAEFPVLQAILMQVAEQEWLKAQNRLSMFKISSPEKRYEDFLKQRPDLIHKIPNNQIASYLGITAESLSRIRKRLLIKAKK